jgi:hypothetical protein
MGLGAAQRIVFLRKHFHIPQQVLNLEHFSSTENLKKMP